MLWLPFTHPIIENYTTTFEKHQAELRYVVTPEDLIDHPYTYGTHNGPTASPDGSGQHPNHISGSPYTNDGYSAGFYERYWSYLTLEFARKAFRCPPLDRDFMHNKGDSLHSSTLTIKFPKFRQDTEGLWAGLDSSGPPSGYSEITSVSTPDSDNYTPPNEGPDWVFASRDATAPTTSGNIRLLYLGIYEVGGSFKKRILGESSVSTATANNEWGDINVLPLTQAYLDTAGDMMAFEIVPIPDIVALDLTGNSDMESDMKSLHLAMWPYSSLPSSEFTSGGVTTKYMVGQVEWKNTMWSSVSLGAYTLAYEGDFTLPDTARIMPQPGLGRRD